jgi:hypothetical protein
MSQNPNPDYGEAIRDFQRGGWITTLFGGAGMLARMLITDECSPLIWWIRRIVASVIVGVLSYFTLWPMDISGIYKAVILTTSGMACPELIEIVVKKYRSKIPNETKKTKKRKSSR